MRKLLKLGLILMTSVLFAGCAKQEVQEQKIPIYTFEEDKNPAPLVIENDKLKLTLDPATTYFQVLDKANNTIWDSNPPDGKNDPKADMQNKSYLQSTLILSYMDTKGIETLYNNYDKSISKLAYQVSQQGDSIEVDYTLGDVQKTYYIPLAVPLSRMQVFLDKMDSSGARKVKTYYRKIDINNLLPDDNKDELLKQYPDLANEPVYQLREGTQEWLKADIQTIFAGVGYTEQDYKDDLARYTQTTSEEKPYFNVSVIYRLEGNDLVVEIPYDKMEYKSNFPITKIQVLPYLGAGTTTDNGFIMVPEGNGAVINFNNGKSEQNPYYSQVYGWDYGESRDSSTDDSSSAYPVFGISKNGSSMLCILENYASVAAIEADVSGRTHSYNWAAARYTTIHESALKVSAKTDQSVIVFEDKKPTGSITQRYRFLESDSYTKMAEAYRGYLMDKHPEMVKKEETSTPVNVSMVGAIDEVKQRFGLPVSVPIALTTYQQAYDILGDLKKTGYDNLSVKYRGWMNGGLKQTALNSVKTISELGSKGKLNSFLDYGNKLGVPIYLEGTVENIFNDGMFDGFLVNRDAAKYASREIVKLYDFSPVYFGIEDWYDPYYFVKTQKAIGYMQTLADYAKSNSAQVAITDVGNILGADYEPKNLLTRDQVIAMQQEELNKIKSAGTAVMLNNGNDYVLPYADFITDMNLGGSHYGIIDEMVPFYTMAIHGLVNYSGTSLNLSKNYQDVILESAESGAGLSFTFIDQPTSILQKSNYTFLFGADYSLWKDKAYEIYSRYNKELGHTFNQFITDHSQLADGVFVTTYEDGTKVYVNYNNTDYSQDGLTVPAKDYKVEGR